jgi:4-hydroxy-4-methyl-2-oxoglutarate aldolase
MFRRIAERKTWLPMKSSPESALTSDQLEAIRRYDTCTVANAVEILGVRLPNEGFADARIRCLFENLPPMIGYAAAGRIRVSATPPSSHRYYDRTDWWDYLLTIPAPRVIVIQDVDDKPGFGAFIGEVHSNILLALGCSGVVTNGGVRDLPGVERLRFPLFAGNVAVSHAFAHLVEFGRPVEVGGLTVSPGDLIFGDRHGVLSIPKEIAAEIPATADRLLAKEREVIEVCQSPEFSLARLRAVVADLS